MKFYNIEILKTSFDLPPDTCPRWGTVAGLSAHGIWFTSMRDRSVYRRRHDMAAIYCAAAGRTFPLRDINLVTIGIYKTEDPADGIGVIDFLASYIPVSELKRGGVSYKEMNRERAELLKALYKKIVLSKRSEKDIHTWLRQTHDYEVMAA